MRRFILFIAILLTSFTTFAQESKRSITVVDESDSNPLPYSAVFSSIGEIVGFTDDSGKIAIDLNDFPVTVKCLGYDQQVCTKDVPVVKLKCATYDLNEVVVVAGERPIERLVCYVRQYISMTDKDDLNAIVQYHESMADIFIPTAKKVKGFKAKKSARELTSATYVRKMTNGRDSFYIPSKSEEMLHWAKFIKMPLEKVTESAAIAGGARIDKVMGKFGCAESYKKNSNGSYLITQDNLADKDNHIWSPTVLKVLGFTSDVYEQRFSYLYQGGNKGTYTPSDLVMSTINISLLGKGKHWKSRLDATDPIQVKIYFEVYPVSVEYLTVEEANELQENAPKEKMQVSPNAPARDAAVRKIIEACKASKH